jgi:hypothetical protein
MHMPAFQIDLETSERYLESQIQTALISKDFFFCANYIQTDGMPTARASAAKKADFSTELSTGRPARWKTST